MVLFMGFALCMYVSTSECLIVSIMDNFLVFFCFDTSVKALPLKNIKKFNSSSNAEIDLKLI